MEQHPQHSYTTCPYCGLTYTKLTKPLIMPCSHNICSECVLFNKSNINCLICNKIFSAKKISQFPVNFELSELSFKQTNANDNENKYKRDFVVYCESCNMNYITNYHKEKYSNHILGKVENMVNNEMIIQQFKEKASDMMKKFQNFQKEFDDLNDKFGFHLFELMKDIIDNKIVPNKNLFDEYTLLLAAGIINPSDRKKLKNFKEKILLNKEYMEIIESSNSFDELEQKFKFVKENSQKEKSLSYDEFLSFLIFFNDLYKNKLSKTNEILSDITEKLNKDIKYKETFINDLAFKTNYLIYGLLIGFEYQCSHLIVNNNVIIFEPCTQTFKTYTIKHNSNQIISSIITSNLYLYILTKENSELLNLYKYDFNKEPTDDSFMLQLPRPHFTSTSSRIFLLGERLYCISPNYFESLTIFDGMELCEWKSRSVYKYGEQGENIKQPYMLTYSGSFLYVIDKAKASLQVIYIYNINKDTWTKTNIESNELDINPQKNCTFYTMGKIHFFGGYFNKTGKFNSNVGEIYLKKKKIITKQIFGKELFPYEEINENSINNNKSLYSVDLSYATRYTYLIIGYLIKDKNQIEFEIYKKQERKDHFVKTDLHFEYKL